MPSDFEKRMAAQRLRRKQQYIQRMTEVDPKGEFDEGRKKSSNISADEMEALRQMFLENQRSSRRDPPEQTSSRRMDLSDKIKAFIENLEARPKEAEKMRFPGMDWFTSMQHRKNRAPLWEALRQLRSRQTPVLEEETRGRDFFDKYISRKLQMAQEVLPFIPPLRGLRGLGKVIPKLRGRKNK